MTKSETQLQILFLEDDAADMEMVEEALGRSGFPVRVKRVDTREDFNRELHENPPDLILSDHGLPGFNGFAALDEARKHCPNIPFLFVSGSLDLALVSGSFDLAQYQRAMREGVAECVSKSRLQDLVPAIERALRLKEERVRHRQIERDLGAATELVRLFSCEISGMTVFHLDVDGRVANWNRGAKALMGYDENEIYGRFFGRLYRREDRRVGKPKRDLQAAVSAGHFEEEGWRVHRDGKPFWMHGIISPRYDEAGGFRGYVHVIRNLTEHRCTETAYSDVESRERRLLTACPAALLVLKQGVITYANAACGRLLLGDDGSADSLIDRLVEDFLPFERREEFGRRLTRLAQEMEDRPVPSAQKGGPGMVLGEEIWVRPDGSRVAVLVTACPLATSDDKTVLFLTHGCEVEQSPAPISITPVKGDSGDRRNHHATQNGAKAPVDLLLVTGALFRKTPQNKGDSRDEPNDHSAQNGSQEPLDLLLVTGAAFREMLQDGSLSFEEARGSLEQRVEAIRTMPKRRHPLQRVQQASQATAEARRSIGAIMSQTRTPWGGMGTLSLAQLEELEGITRVLDLRLDERELALAESEAKLEEQDRRLSETEALLRAREEVLNAMKQAAETDSVPHRLSTEEVEAVHRLKAEIERQQESLKKAREELNEREEFIEHSEATLLEKMHAQQVRESELEQKAEELRVRSREPDANHVAPGQEVLSAEEAQLWKYFRKLGMGDEQPQCEASVQPVEESVINV